MKNVHLHIVKSEEKEQKRISFFEWFRKKRELKKAKEHQHKVLFLEAYFSRLYEQLDKDTIAIPCFIKAKDTVQDIVYRGLLDDVYNHITKRGLAC